MRNTSSFVAVVLAIGLAAGCGAPTPTTLTSASGGAEIVLSNGSILTMDAAHPRARAIAMSAGKIVFVGDDASPWIGPRTRVIDLAGRSVVPALTDAHAHLESLGETLEQVALEGCASPDECSARVARGTPNEGGWILGHGWDQNRFPDKKFPSHDVLDKVAADKPVWLSRVDGHAGWANARALALAGIDKKTPDPDGGKILRDASGEATGVLVDNAMALIEKKVPPLPDAAIERVILRAQAVALSHGITEVHEPGIDEATVRVYRRLAKEDKLAIRVYALKSFDPAKDASPTGKATTSPDPLTPHSYFTLKGIKIFADGAMGSRGAALFAPYSDDPQNSGLVLTPEATIERAARQALASGWQLGIHAIGDKANRSVLDAFQRAGCKPGTHRFRIEHAQVLEQGDFKRLSELGVIASMQPTHATSDMPWAEARLGPDRAVGSYAWRRMIDAGALLAFGSDFPVEDVSLIAGLHAATTRTDSKGQPDGGWFADQRMSLDEALHAFTTGAAYAAYEESWRGRAVVGQAADLTVFDRDLTKTPRLLDAKIKATIVGGKIRYEAP